MAVVLAVVEEAERVTTVAVAVVALVVTLEMAVMQELETVG
jgi:hypothetical protein